MTRTKKLPKTSNNQKYFTEEERKKAQLRANAKWEKKSMTAFTLKFNNQSDELIIAKLKNEPNKVDYIRKLINADLEK